jgi:hypothetical protein
LSPTTRIFVFIPSSNETHLVPVYSNPIMLAYHLYDGQIKMTERADFAIVATTAESDSTNHKSTINNSQSGSGFAGLGIINGLEKKVVKATFY